MSKPTNFYYVCNNFAQKTMTHQKLRQFILDENWEQTYTLFQAMSNTEFRRAEEYVRIAILPQLGNESLWTTLLHLVQYRRQAFLSGVLAVRHLVADSTLRFEVPSAQAFFDYLQQQHPESIPKTVNMILPLLDTEPQIESLFHVAHIEKDRSRIALLLKVESPQAYHLLFNTLCHLSDNRKLALDCSRYILKRGNDMASNMVSILQAYFGLHEIRGPFSLHIEPYELSRLERGEQIFYHLLNGKRPQL